MSDALGRKAGRSALWCALESACTGVAGLAVSIVLSRLLMPREFGLVAMLQLFVAVGCVFADSGLSQALIRLNRPTRVQMSSAFTANMLLASLTYIILWLCAPAIASFFGKSELCPLARVLGLSIPLNALGMAQGARLSAEMRFRRLLGIGASSVAVSGTVGIVMALTGWGVWALVWQQLSMWGTRAALLWLTSGHSCGLRVELGALRSLLTFSWPLVLSALLDAAWTNIYAPLIGRFFTPRLTGLFWRADSLSMIAPRAMGDVAGRVAYPVMSRLREGERERAVNAYARVCGMALWASLPVCALLAALAPQLVEGVLGSRWLPCVPYLRVLCASACFYPLHLLCVQALNVYGHSRRFLRLELIKKGMGVAMLCICLPLGVQALCWGIVIEGVASLWVNIRFSAPYTGLGAAQMTLLALPPLGASIAAGVLAWQTAAHIHSLWWAIALGLAVGIVLYLMLTARLPYLRYLISILHKEISDK